MPRSFFFCARRSISPLHDLVRIAGLLLATAIAGTPVAHAGTVVSYGRAAGLVDIETLGGTTVRPTDLVDVNTSMLAFGAFGDNPAFEDLDAAFIRANGNVIFSTDTDVGGGVLPGLDDGFRNGDLIEWDGSEGSLFFDEDKFTSGLGPNISAFHLFESGPNAGKFVLGTESTGDVLGGIALEWGNLVLYDPGTDTSSLFFDQDLIGGTLTQKTLDAVHVLANGNFLLSSSIDNGTLGGVTLKAKDVVEYNPMTNITVDPVFLNGTSLFDGSTRNIDAVHIPEPGTVVLLGLGLAGLATPGRRQKA